MKYYNLHTHNYENLNSVIALVNQYPWDFKEHIKCYSVGIHPWYIDANRLEKDLQLIEEKIQLNECLAIGECGLDKRIEIDFELQKSVFIKQIELAEKYKKPLVLHLVAAFDELIEIKKQLNISVPIVIHGFSKSKQLANQLIENNFYLSFGKYLLRNIDLIDVFQSIPNDKYLLETDTIEETIQDVYQKAANYKKVTVEEIKLQVEQNWQKIFKD